MLGEAAVAETGAGQGALLFLCLRWTAQLLMCKTLLQLQCIGSASLHQAAEVNVGRRGSDGGQHGDC